ncbi:membrane protein [Polaribacter pacificus]|uniref:Membrane protein n=1 Tax=Polaribacter pacificus TaxID=1775173 RepID=A0A917I084_9FLAO|nr:DUF4105 domain-containing protein [Polaribacter pacificus]GGG99453.1 membrane protein [Polaribacter pacificus]
MPFIDKSLFILKKHFVVFFIIIAQTSWSQEIQLTDYAEVSVITAGPGNELYEGFGHSTIRIVDKKLGIDLAYNYGIFDFDAPNFYLNFAKGKMLYKLQRYPFYLFVKSYQQDRRWIKEQVLNLNLVEKQQFFEFLETNAKPENASYFYDPFFNNCATKIPEITKIILKEKVSFNTKYANSNLSIRQLMNNEIPWNTWGSFGINLALGSKIDQSALANDYLYLPDYVSKAFNFASINNNGQIENLVKETRNILTYKEIALKSSLTNPLLIFSLILIIGLYITFLDIKKKSLSKWFDSLIFLITGLIGVIICFLWFFTDHSATPNNFNLLWAFAPNLFVAFGLRKGIGKRWLKNYLLIALVMIFAVFLVWIFKIQLLPTAVFPFLILITVRYFWLLKYSLLTSKK